MVPRSVSGGTADGPSVGVGRCRLMVPRSVSGGTADGPSVGVGWGS